MIEDLYPGMIVAGMTIGLVLLYLWRQSRKTERIGLEMLRLNEQLGFDTPAFLRQAWPLLAQAGLRGIAWRLDWFGMPVETEHGKADGECVARDMKVGDMRLRIRIYWGSARGERRYFNESLIETFLLLLRTDMWIKAGTVDATFAQMAKLTLFLQHDMKNVAQFIQLMTDQLASVGPDREPQMLAYLRTAAPLIRERADRIVGTLVASSVEAERRSMLGLRHRLEQLCRLHRLDCDIEGDAELHFPERVFDNALDNILKNYSDIALQLPALRPRVSIAIRLADAHVEILVEAAGIPAPAEPERLFEPFWTTNPGGLGIGLYQARQMLEQCGATLSAIRVEPDLLRFRIGIPVTEPET